MLPSSKTLTQEAHAEALTKLGSSAEGSRLRAQLHSVALLSDMQVNTERS